MLRRNLCPSTPFIPSAALLLHLLLQVDPGSTLPATPAVSVRIVNGGEPSHQLVKSAVYLESSETNIAGGGTLISPDWILSAAHIIDLAATKLPQGIFEKSKKLFVPLRAVLAVWVLRRQDRDNWPWMEIDLIIKHPNFRLFGRQSYNDIALLRLERRTAPGCTRYNGATYEIQPVRLPEPEEHPIDLGKRLRVSGYGATGDPAFKVKDIKLLEANLEVRDHSECRQEDQNVTLSICFGDIGQGGPSSGDSGSGLIGDPFNRGTPAIFGIHVRGISNDGPACNGNGDANHVAIRVTAFLPWIKRQLSQFTGLAPWHVCNCKKCPTCPGFKLFAPT